MIKKYFIFISILCFERSIAQEIVKLQFCDTCGDTSELKLQGDFVKKSSEKLQEILGMPGRTHNIIIPYVSAETLNFIFDETNGIARISDNDSLVTQKINNWLKQTSSFELQLALLGELGTAFEYLQMPNLRDILAKYITKKVNFHNPALLAKLQQIKEKKERNESLSREEALTANLVDLLAQNENQKIAYSLIIRNDLNPQFVTELATDKPLSSVMYTTDGKHIITTDKESVKVFNLDGSMVRQIPVVLDRLQNAENSTVIGLSGTSLKKVNLETGDVTTKTFVAPAPRRMPKQVAALSPDSSKIIIDDNTKTISVFDVSSSELLTQLDRAELLEPIHVNPKILTDSLQFSQDGDSVALVVNNLKRSTTGIIGKGFMIIDLEKKNITSAEFLKPNVSAIAVAPDLETIAALHSDNKKAKLIFETGNIQELSFDYQPQSISLSPTGDELLVTFAGKPFFALINLQTNQLHYFGRQGGHSYELAAAGFFPDGNQIITIGMDQTAKIWNTKSGGLVSTITLPKGILKETTSQNFHNNSLQFSPDTSSVILMVGTKTTIWKFKPNLHEIIDATLKQEKNEIAEFLKNNPEPLKSMAPLSATLQEDKKGNA